MSIHTTDTRSEQNGGEHAGVVWDRWSLGTVLVGVVLMVIHAIHVNEMLYWGMVGVVVEGMVPFVFAGMLVLSGSWLSYRGYDSDERQQVFKWMIVFAIVIGLLFLWSLSHQYVLELPFPHEEYVTTTNLTAGALLGIVIGIYDVRTQRHREIAETERERSELQRSRLSVLNRILRHNIRNDANIVQGICSDIGEQTTGEISTRASTAAGVMSDLHHLSEKARRIDETLADEHDLVDEVELRSLFEEATSTHEREADGVTYEFDVAEDVPTIQTSERLLSEIVNELLENTVEHGGDELTQVELSASHEDGWVDIVVEDDGPGLPTIEHESLQFGIERDIEHTSGIGLWFSKWGTEVLGGDLRFGEGRDGGTVVYMRIPAAR